MSKFKWNAPHEVSYVEMEFPVDVVGTLLPMMADIPEEFYDHYNKWNRLAMGLFFNGGELPKVKDGIDPGKAKRHLIAVLRSFEPKHEHKVAGAGWLMSMWYEMPKGTN